MKRVLSIILVAVLALSLVGCGGSKNKDTTKKENTVKSADDLPGKKIGVQIGTTGDILATDDYEDEGATIERFSHGADAVLALSQGKIDCVIIDQEPAKVYVDSRKGLKILDDPFADEDYAICLAKDNTKLKEEINGALAKLKEDGTLDKIMDNYIGDNAGKTPYESPANVDRSKGTLVMATNAEFPPYEYFQNEDIVGIDPDMARAVCDVLGYELKIEHMGFDAVITAVISGKADMGVAGLSVTEDRLKNVDFTDTYATSTQVIIVNE